MTRKRMILAGLLTLLLVVGAFGFWLADYQSGKIAFNKQDRRVDVIINASSCEIVLRDDSLFITWPDKLLQAIKGIRQLLPPDVQGTILLLEHAYNK